MADNVRVVLGFSDPFCPYGQGVDVTLSDNTSPLQTHFAHTAQGVYVTLSDNTSLSLSQPTG